MSKVLVGLSGGVDSDQKSIAQGQSVAIYKEDTVATGGIIEEVC